MQNPNWMWAEACALIEQAERLKRQFFQLGLSLSDVPHWEPPVDIIETGQRLIIVVALPGVAPERIVLRIEADALIVIGERRIPAGVPARIRRLEIPYGRFERRIGLPRGRFEIEHQAAVNGCLELSLRKI